MVTALVGAALFMLGVVYLNLGQPADVPALLVVGGERVRPGATSTLRVSARMVGSREAAPVEVGRVTVDGQGGRLSVGGGDVRIVTFEVPDKRDREVLIELEVSAGDRREVLTLSMPVSYGEEVELSRDPPQVHGGGGGRLRIDVWPEAVELALGMDNRVFVRVRDDSGKGVAGAHVVVTHRAIEGGRFEATTDASGLADFMIRADRPSLRLKVEVTEAPGAMEPGAEPARSEELLRPFGRQLLLHPERPTVGPGERAEATLESWEDAEPVWCDLWQDGVVFWSERVRTKEHRARIELPPLRDGLYQLQCATHPFDPGEAWAVLPVMVTRAEPLAALMDAVRQRDLIDPQGLQDVEGEAARRAADYYLSLLREPPKSLTTWVSTREADIEARKAQAGKRRGDVLLAIGLVLVLIIAWVLEHVLRNIVKTRRQMRDFALEAALDAPLEDMELDESELSADAHASHQKLIATRGWLAIFVLIGTLIANVVGLLWLLSIAG